MRRGTSSLAALALLPLGLQTGLQSGLPSGPVGDLVGTVGDTVGEVVDGVRGALVEEPDPEPRAGGSLHTKDVVLRTGCHHHTYRYDLDVPTDSWYLTVEVVGPGGKVITRDHPYAGSGRGTSYFQLCDYRRAGKYTLRGHGEWYAETVQDEAHEFKVKATRFDVRRHRG